MSKQRGSPASFRTSLPMEVQDVCDMCAGLWLNESQHLQPPREVPTGPRLSAATKQLSFQDGSVVLKLLGVGMESPAMKIRIEAVGKPPAGGVPASTGTSPAPQRHSSSVIMKKTSNQFASAPGLILTQNEKPVPQWDQVSTMTDLPWNGCTTRDSLPTVTRGTMTKDSLPMWGTITRDSLPMFGETRDSLPMIGEMRDTQPPHAAQAFDMLPEERMDTKKRVSFNPMPDLPLSAPHFGGYGQRSVPAYPRSTPNYNLSAGHMNVGQVQHI